MTIKKRILLYYKYVDIENSQKVRDWQFALCQSLDLTGRVIVGTEGINGTLCGSLAATDDYIAAMNEHALFKNIDFKSDIVNGHYQYFVKLQVLVKREIVNLGIDSAKLSSKNGGKHLTPAQAHELMVNPPDNLVLLDGRNYFEARIGTFKNAITPKINHFRDFPTYIDQHEELFKDKQVLMFCTGGIRCERASAYLQSKNIAQQIYQIEGGICRYTQQYPDGFFRGKNYVFDARVSVKINDDILSTCDLCTTPCDDYTNCRNAQCNKHFICCSTCLKQLNNTCNAICFDLISKSLVPERPYYPKVDASITE